MKQPQAPRVHYIFLAFFTIPRSLDPLIQPTLASRIHFVADKVIDLLQWLQQLSESPKSILASTLSPSLQTTPVSDPSSALLHFYEELLANLSSRLFVLLPSSSASALPSSVSVGRQSTNLLSKIPFDNILNSSQVIIALLFVLIPLFYFFAYSSSAFVSAKAPLKLTFMSWASRFGSWGGRFSPFGRPEAEYDDANGNKDHVHGSVPADAKITDGDFSYITSADLAAVEEAGGLEPERQPSQQQSTTTQTRDDHHHNKHKSHHHSSKHNGHHATSGGVPIYDGSGDKPSTVEAASPNRETDVLVLKHKRIAHPVHFPAFSIARGELHVGEIRSCAAQRLKVHAPRKVKLLHRGRNLRDDSQTAQDAGLAAGGEIMCIVGDSLGGGRGERYHGMSFQGSSGAIYCSKCSYSYKFQTQTLCQYHGKSSLTWFVSKLVVGQRRYKRRRSRLRSR